MDGSKAGTDDHMLVGAEGVVPVRVLPPAACQVDGFAEEGYLSIVRVPAGDQARSM